MGEQQQTRKPPHLNESTVTEYIRSGEDNIKSSSVPPSPKQQSLVYEQHHTQIQTPPVVDLSPCTICGRKFAPATLIKHVGICQKAQTKKRRTFDSSKQRREGTDLADFLPKNFALPQNKVQLKEQHQQLHLQHQPHQQHQQHQQQNQDINRISPPRIINPVKKEVVNKNLHQLNETNNYKSNNNNTSNHNLGTNSNYNITNNNNNSNNPQMPVNSGNNSSIVSARSVKRNLGPVQEQCPHCERYFGIKAYDRHVEWCKEKSRFVNNQNSTASLNAAKERLQARTKYKAPCLKTKRALTREKYSGLTCGDSTNSLSDNNLSTNNNTNNNQMSKSYSAADETRQRSMSNSMTSSFTSDGGFSDNYDPFLSAKKQFEELFSPTTANNNCKNKNFINNTSTPKIIKLNSNNNNNNNSNNKNNLKNTKTNSTSNSITNLYNSNCNNINSNFKRTSSLRLPNKKLPTTPTIPLTPIFLTNNMKPKIQRGISDEGPISPNFIKSKEYDEIPIKSVYGNELIQQQQNLQHYHQQQQQQLTPKLRDSHAIQNRKNNLKLDIKSATGGNDFSLSKTDSLAVFLKYENDFNLAQQQQQQLDQKEQQQQQTQQQQQIQQKPMTEKDIKDKSNIISKRSSSIINKLPIKLEPINLNSITKLTMKKYGNHNDDINYIDPKLINLCDNLPINIQKLNDSDTTQTTTTTDSSLSGESIKKLLLSEDDIDNNFNQMYQQQQQRNSGERKNILKRQLKLNRDNFLYVNPTTTSPTINTTTPTIDKNETTHLTTINSNQAELNSQQTPTNMQVKLHELDNNLDEKFLNLKKSRNDVRLLLDDFDFDEFLTSFEDDDKHPIFKDYKEFLQLQKQQQQFDSNGDVADDDDVDDDDDDDVVEHHEEDSLPINLQLNALTISNVNSNNNNNNSLFNINRNEKHEKHVVSQRQLNQHNKHDQQQTDDIYLSSPESLKLENDILLVPTTSPLSIGTHLMHKSINENSYCEPLKIDILSNNSDENDLDDDDDDIDENEIEEINEIIDEEDLLLDDEDDYNDNNDIQMVQMEQEDFVRPLSSNSYRTIKRRQDVINDDFQKNDCEDGDDNNFTELEKDLLKSCNELNDILTDSNTILNSDDITNIDNNYQLNLCSNKKININNVKCINNNNNSNNNTNNNNNNINNNINNNSNYNHLTSKISSDSAYGSLSRQTPPDYQQKQQWQQQQQQWQQMQIVEQKPQQTQYPCRSIPSRIQQQSYLMPEIKTGIARSQIKTDQTKKTRQDYNKTLSSSGSESSLPPLVTTGQKMEIHQTMSASNNSGNKKEKIQLSALSPNDGGGAGRMSKFCHECGYRFMLPQAKFCMECGVKRVVL